MLSGGRLPSSHEITGLASSCSIHPPGCSLLDNTVVRDFDYEEASSALLTCSIACTLGPILTQWMIQSWFAYVSSRMILARSTLVEHHRPPICNSAASRLQVGGRDRPHAQSLEKDGWVLWFCDPYQVLTIWKQIGHVAGLFVSIYSSNLGFIPIHTLPRHLSQSRGRVYALDFY